jgi:hypothetical protein
MQALDRFAALADRFQVWAAEGTDTGAAAGRQALTHLAALFAAALALPAADREGDISERISDDEWKRVFEACRRLPVTYYGAIFDPLKLPPEPPSVGDVADDLADIYRDVVSGLRAFRQGEPGAVWHWRFTFWEHWGRHAVSAMAALRAWLEADATGW